MKKYLFLLLFFLWIPALVHGEWYCFSSDAVPLELTETAMQVQEDGCSVTLSFLGDCTLGGEKRLLRNSLSFFKVVQEKGIVWPFSGLSEYLLTDDITLVNLEGVLSDHQLIPAEKEFCFIGETDYTDILLCGGVDAVTLSNNHTFDYGNTGYEDTKQALSDAKIAYTGFDTLAVCDCNGLRIGFTSSAFTLNSTAKDELQKNILLLRSLGCDVLIHSMHAGQEYQSVPNAQQKDTVKWLSTFDVDLVVGHHPHIVQGMDTIGVTTVFYSLGNAVFGGNTSPSDYDALLLQATFTLKQDHIFAEYKLFPISVSSSNRCNDYHPVLLDLDGANRVLKKMIHSTGYDPSGIMPILY